MWLFDIENLDFDFSILEKVILIFCFDKKDHLAPADFPGMRRCALLNSLRYSNVFLTFSSINHVDAGYPNFASFRRFAQNRSVPS